MTGLQNDLLEVNDVHKGYTQGRKGDRIDILKGVCLSVNKGESLAVTGPSGCGKSTLLNIIGALDQPDSGSVVFDGMNIAGLNNKSLSELRLLKIGFVFQEHHLLPQCSALENVLMPTLPLRNRRASTDYLERARNLLDRVGLGARMNHMPAQLSGGERQRVAVVRALINKPKLILADEPTGSLDEYSAKTLSDLLLNLNRADQLSLIVVTHSTELGQRMNRNLFLKDGTLHDFVEVHS